MGRESEPGEDGANAVQRLLAEGNTRRATARRGKLIAEGLTPLLDFYDLRMKGSGLYMTVERIMQILHVKT